MCFAYLRATTACTFSTSQLLKEVRPWCALYILTWKCASRHNGVHFFDIATSNSGPRTVCVLCILTSKCASPTTACNCSSLIWPDGSAPAALASLLFDPPEPQIIGKTQWIATFLPFGTSASSFFWLFLFSDLLSWAFLFSLTLPISACHLSILSEVWLQNFCRLQHIHYLHHQHHQHHHHHHQSHLHHLHCRHNLFPSVCTCVLPALLPARAIPSPTLLPARLSLHQVLHQVTSVDSLFQLQRAACHAKAAETKGHQRDARGTPGRTSDPLAMDIVPRLPRKSGRDQGTPVGHQRDARAYIRPLGNGHCPTPATQKRRRPRDTRGTPEGRQGVHPTP